MAIKRITIQEFESLSAQLPVLDVRSPGEYTHAHIPGAVSLPLFSDEERKVVGTAYKQQSRQTAIKIGLDYFGPKMRTMVETVERLLSERSRQYAGAAGNQPQQAVIVHCWRGGMRSAGVAWLLDLYGFSVYTLVGGYKAYRQWVRLQFEKPYPLYVLGGYTGSGKTLVLQHLQQQGHAIVDLEKIAVHKGSAFGGMSGQPQPTQEMFENLLALQLHEASLLLQQKADTPACIWIEDESQRIGNLQIPMPLWNTMRSCTVVFADIPFEERLQYLTKEYGQYPKEKLVNAVIRIQKRLGGLETKNAINHLLEDNFAASFAILLRYYDKWYGKALYNREHIQEQLVQLPIATIDAPVIAAAVVDALQQHTSKQS